MPDPDLLRQVLSRVTAGRRWSEADLFAERRTTLRIDLQDGLVTAITGGLEEGAAVRTSGPAHGRFFFTDGLDEASLHSLAGIEGAASPPSPATAAGTPNSQRLLAALQAITTEAERLEPGCRQVAVSCHAFRRQVWIVDESGRLAEDDRSAVRVRAEVDFSEASGFSLHGSAWTDDPMPPAAARELARRAVDAARRSADTIPLPRGSRPMVLAAGGGGVLVHETCGHLLEADYVLSGRSPFGGMLGRSVASPLISVVDDPSLSGYPGSQRVDDEGSPARRKLLLGHGILRAYLCGRREAATGGDGFTPGNARRRSFRHVPLPRMSNTLVLAGESDPEEIIRTTDRGLFVTHLSAGQVDPATGRFRFTASEGSLIEGGRRTAPLEPFLVSGSASEALAAVDLVGHDLRVDPTAAACTKAGQAIPVSAGHPTLRLGSLMAQPLGTGGKACR